MRGSIFLLGTLLVASALADDPAFRTDGGNEKLPWFQIKPGEFPPEGSAHAISGELIRVDHVHRTGAIRVDRTGAQRTDEYDHALEFTLLPYASLGYHGAPADLKDIPLGTHLHGWFYEEQKGNKKVFSQCLRLEDDFTHLATAKRLWRIDAVDQGKKTLTITGVDADGGNPDAKPTVYQITPATRVWKDKSIASWKDLAAGQTIVANLTVCTLKGPGRCTDIWIDPPSRDAASAVQMEIHRVFQREHGLACIVEECDNKAKIVTVTFFGGVDPELIKNFKPKDYIAGAVATNELRTHDQINDTARGPITEVLEGPKGPGRSGVWVRFQPDILLEGYRPGLYLRLFGPGWHIDDLPREERAYDG